MRAFWAIRPNDNGQPDYPAGFQAMIVNGDLRLVQPGTAPADHRHTTIGSIAIGTNHYHWFFIWKDTIFQDYVGNVANEHSHDFTLLPTHFLIWVLCTEQQYDDLLVAAPGVVILGENAIETIDEVDVIGSVDLSIWTPETRTSWETLVSNFGIELPVQVVNDRRLVQWALQTFNARGQTMVDERNYRLGEV